jgi:8-oxo-dGTP diphosphatase
MEVRQMATAFLTNQEKVLMMKKTSSKLSATEFWSGLGGHLEPIELNHPRKACIREIYEESGFQEKEIDELKLRYILLRKKEEEIRQQFVYFGKIERMDFTNSEEGKLHWINQDDLLKLNLSRIIYFMLKHYYENPDQEGIMVGTITVNHEERPKVQWAELKDPQIF